MHRLTRTGTLALITAVFSVTATAQYSQPVRDVENPARTPFTAYASGGIPVNWVSQLISVGTVPAGKRLVIESVGVSCTTDTDDNISLVTINVITGTLQGWYSVPFPIAIQKQGTTFDGKASWVASQPVRLYSDGVNYNTQVAISHAKVTAAASCFAFVSGHTIATQ
ncbi:MAG: hypothetical protein HY235_11620 [Acidobacteria bacterium]|nr:hypothetical protein [Acidobacteriota bacterium]